MKIEKDFVLWVVPRKGAKTNREFVQRFIDYSDKFKGYTLGGALDSFKFFLDEGWFIKTENFLALKYYSD